MAYNKPGVEVSQVQKTKSAVLNTPDLEGVIVGNAYWWQDPTWEDSGSQLYNSVWGTKFVSNGNPVTIPLSDINPVYNDIVAGDGELVIVDLLGVSGPSTGKTMHLKYGTDFSVNETTNTITCSGMTETGGTSEFLVKVGFRAKNPNAVGFKVIGSSTEIEELLGEAVSWNPLAFGVNIAMNNSGTKFNALGVEWTADPGSNAINAINDVLSLKDIFAIGVATHKITASDLKAHCSTQSLPENKKERIAFVNNVISYPDNPTTLTSTQRATIAAAVRDANSAIGSQRVYSIHPDRAFVVETRHISTIKPSWINKSFNYTTTIDFTTYGPYAKFVADTVVGGIKYKAGQDITESVWTNLMANNWAGASGMVTVYAPVPGYYYTAQACGQVIGTTPEQPLTNVAGSGLAKTYGSQDIFSEAELNIMAEGGTWIMTQDSEFGPIYCRHQMSTDITSVAKRELSVVKALDYTAKFMRKSLKPYIGKYNITPAFIDLVDSILFNVGRFLVRMGVIEDLKVLSVTQNELQQDVLEAEVNVLPKYPVNYIKIKLTF
jgi:hypothetical protein